MQGSPRIEELRQKFHENPRRYFAPLANEYRKAGDPEQAIAICRAHLAQQPAHMSGHVVYGQALYDAKRPEEARTVFEKALSLDPDNTVVLRQLGDIAREKGESAEARHWYGKALDLDPQDRETAAYIAELTEPLVGDHAEQEPGRTIPDAPRAADGEGVTPGSADAPSLEDEIEGEAGDGTAAATPPEPQGDGTEAPTEPEAPAGPEVVDGQVDVPGTREPAVEPAPEAPANESPVADQPASAPVAAEELSWRKTPKPEESPFVTRTMAELYAKQGYHAAALDVYRQLAIRHPDDADIRERIAELSGGDEPALAAEVAREGAAAQVRDEGAGAEVGSEGAVAEVDSEGAVAQVSSEAAPEPDEPAAPVETDFVPIEEYTSRFEAEETQAVESSFDLEDVPAESPYPPSAEDLNLAAGEPSESGATHFTEMEISETPDAPGRDSESPFGDLAWDEDLTGFGIESTEPIAFEPSTIEETGDTALAGFTEPEAAAPEAELAAESELAPQAELPPAADTGDARFVNMPVALGEFQTSIDEAGVAATSPHAEDFPPAAPAERVAEAATESVAGEDEAAAAMIEPVQPEGADEEHAVVAYAPEPPRDEDLPHFRPRTPTIREFFATLGSRRPPSRDAGPSITANAGAQLQPPSAEQPEEDLPLATDAFSSLFADSPVSEEDSRAAFALNAALSGTAHNPNLSTVRTSPPQPAPAVPDPEQNKESEEDIRRFREWLEGLADS